jgi:8-oxo-dGTP diphosphatase
MANHGIHESGASDVIKVGVQCFVMYDSRLLLGQRAAGFGARTWGLPGGHLEQGETILEAAARELREETDIVAKSMRVVVVGDPIPENNFHLQIGVLVETWQGEPKVVAPEECDELNFFSVDDLPTPLFVSSEYIIHKFLKGILY